MTDQLDDNQIFERVRTLVSVSLDIPIDKVTADARFRADLAAESLDLLSIITELEELYDAEIPDDDVEKLVTVRDAAACVKRMLTVKNKR